MNNKGYSTKEKNFKKDNDNEINIGKLGSNKHILSILKDTIITEEGMNNSAPPKRRKSQLKKRLNKKNKTSLIKKDSEANSNNNSFENKEEPGQYQIQMKKEFNEGIERIPDRKKSMKNLNLNF